MASSPTDQKVILDLGDECLQKVFRYLNLLDLCTVADVCSRFGQNAKTCFVNSKKTDLIFMEDIKSDGDSEVQTVDKTSKILRQFGAYFTKFDGEDWPNNRIGHWSRRSQVECQRRIFELLIQYCSGTLVELKFFGININDKMVPLMKPLLEGLEILQMNWIRTGQAFLDMLPQWSMNLRELTLCYYFGYDGLLNGQVLRYDRFHMRFNKLVKIVLEATDGLTNRDIEEMLKRNPQLKKIEFHRCRNVDRGMFASIANHVPDVEFLRFDAIPFLRQDVQYFGQFRNLTSLRIYPTSKHLKSEHIVLLIHQIAEASIPLETLELFSVNFHKNRSDASQFVGGVSKLKSLDKLTLRMLQYLPTSHHYIICKNLSQLREISLQPTLAIEPFFISDIIRQADKLEWFHLSSQLLMKGEKRKKIPFIDSIHFKEWAEIVRKRCHGTPLAIWLGANAYNTKHTIPVRASEGAFSLLIYDDLSCRLDIGNKQSRKYFPITCRFVDNF